jgi:hypothetical protein
MLQETHIIDENIIKMYGKINFVSSCESRNKGGIMTQFDCINVLRITLIMMIVIEKELVKALVVNVYCPNDQKISYRLMEKVYDKFLNYWINTQTHLL